MSSTIDARIVNSAEKKFINLIEAAPFGRLDQMLSLINKDDRLGGSGGALAPQPKTGGSWGQRPAAKTEKF